MNKLRWVVGVCSHPNCPFTLVTPIGAGQFVCWAHALRFGLGAP